MTHIRTTRKQRKKSLKRKVTVMTSQKGMKKVKTKKVVKKEKKK